MRRRTSVVSTIVLVAVLAAGVILTGCRTGAAPEAGLPAEIFAKDNSTITRGARGGWFAVAPGSKTLAGFVSITHADNTELFYAMPKGERTAAILPITPTSRAWLHAAEDQAVELQFADDPARLDVTDPVGLWSGEADSPVTWLGEKPQSTVMTAALPTTAPGEGTRIGEHISGVVEVSDTRATVFDGNIQAADAGYLLLPEPDASKKRVVVVNTTGQELDALGEDIDVVRKSAGVTFDGRPTEYEYLPVGRKLGADILVFDANGRTYVAAIGPSKFTLHEGALRAVSVARTALTASAPDAIGSAARGLAYVMRRAPLAATWAFDASTYAVGVNQHAASFRIAELAGAAGLAEWAHIPIFEDAEGPSADRMLYFGNAISMSPQTADRVTAESFYREAASGFTYWANDKREMGQARARTALGLTLAARGEAAEGAEMLMMALDKYKGISQPLYAADTEMLLADVYVLADQNQKALEKAEVARSRYYHSNARYHAALAEMKMAELLLLNGDAAEAAKTAGYARQRLTTMGEPVAANRASVVELLAKSEAGSLGADASTRLAQAFERAQNLNDAEGASMAASAVALLTNVRDSERLARIGTALVEGSDYLVDPLSRARADRAIGVLCAQGLSRVADSANGRVERACADAMKDVSGDPATLRSWLAQGYSHLQSGNGELARATLQDLEAQLGDELRTAEPVLAGRIMVYRWAVGQLDDTSDDETIERAMDLFRNGLDPQSAAGTLADMARTQRARGLSDVAIWTLSLAAQQARDAKQYDVERATVLELLAVHRQLSDWSALRAAAQDAKTVMSRGGQAASAQLAQAELYLAHAYYMLDKKADGDLSSTSAFERAKSGSDAERLELFTLATEFALERGNTEGALSRASSLKNLLAKGAGSKLTASRAHLARADSHLAAGNGTSALDAYAAALASVRTASIGSGGVERLRALTRLAGLSNDVSAVEDYESQVERALQTEAPDASPLETASAYRLGIEYHMGESDAGRANRLLGKLHSYGLSAEARFATDCVDGSVLLANGNSDAGIPRLERCVERSGKSPRGELARVTLALADAEMAAQNKAAVARQALDTVGAELPVYERSRLEWMVEYAKPSTTFDANRAERLKKAAKKSEKPADLAAYADYLIASGRTAQASSFIDTNSTAFFREGQESPGELIRLRLETTVRQLQPGAADFYAQRSLSEAVGVGDAAMARIQLLLAQNSVIAGNWWSAHRNLQEARDLAKSAGDSALQKRIASFADTFSILSFSE